MSLIGMAGRWYDRQQAAQDATGSRSTAGNRAQEHTDRQPLEQLASFFPVDVITLYVATIGFLSAAAGAPADETDKLVRLVGGISPWAAYFFFAFVVTPALAGLAILIKRKEARKAGTQPVAAVPWWPIATAILAFLGWALAVPGLLTNDILKVGASVAALLTSIVLTQLDRLFG